MNVDIYLWDMKFACCMSCHASSVLLYVHLLQFELFFPILLPCQLRDDTQLMQLHKIAVVIIIFTL